MANDFPVPAEPGHAPSGSSGAPVPRRSLSIARKLGAAIGLLQVAVAGSLVAFFLQQEASDLRADLRARADTYGRLVSAQVRSAVAFDDRETTREVFGSLAEDADLKGVALYTSSGETLHTWGVLSTLAERARYGVDRQRVFNLPGRVLAVVPVASLEGPTGTLALELSEDHLLANLRRSLAVGLALGALTLLLGALVAWRIAASFARRLGTIALAAGQVATGDLEGAALAEGAADEIGSLVRSFNTMVRRLRALMSETARRSASERERLDRLVHERTLALGERNDDMRRVLENVDQGLLTLDRNGVMSTERSSVLVTWLGAPPPSDNLWDYVEQRSPGAKARFEVAWEEVVNGFLPLEVNLAQMPARIVSGSRHLAFEYRPICAGGGDEFERLLVVIRDVTAAVLGERACQEEAEFARLVTRMIADRRGVLEFFGEATSLVETIAAPDVQPIALLRSLHTLKGNCAVFGLSALAELVHTIEGTLAETRRPLSPEDRAQLVDAWEGIRLKLAGLLNDPTSDEVVISSEEYARIAEAVTYGAPRPQITDMVAAWRFEPVALRFARLQEQIGVLGRRLGKGDIVVTTLDNQLRFDPHRLSGVWGAMPHLIRNAVDHGLETAEERQLAGKRGGPAITLAAERTADAFLLRLSDNGRGLDWERLRMAAIRRGLPSDSRADLISALFADGVTTKAEPTVVSGRGVGMSALRAAIEQAGGTFEVESSEQGTTFLMRFCASVAPEPVELALGTSRSYAPHSGASEEAGAA